MFVVSYGLLLFEAHLQHRLLGRFHHQFQTFDLFFVLVSGICGGKKLHNVLKQQIFH